MSELPTQYQHYIHLSRYARYLADKGRRETWEETVDRYITFFQRIYKKQLDNKLWTDLRNGILNLEVMPSMRCLMTAGTALERDNVAGYNCAYVAVDHQRIFDEILYVLMCGTGVGFSVERQYIQKLPIVADKLYPTDTTIVVADSKIGWAKAVRELISMLYSGQIPKVDVSRVRPVGSVLKTFGGRACLTGDTILYKDRKKSKGQNEITIKELFDLERSQGFWKRKANHFNDIKLRSVDEKTGKIFRNKVITVIDNGKAPVWKVTTKNGYEIKATENHRFMDYQGEWKYFRDFASGHLIAVNGTEKKPEKCHDCGKPISRRALRCQSCATRASWKENPLGTSARQRKECRQYKKEYCEICGIKDMRFEIHHIDENPTNNSHDNLLNLCCKCHQQEHARMRTYGNSYSHKYLSWDEISSIEYVGYENVYDLQMEAPNHNFVANGLISHNSGPGPLLDLFEFATVTFRNAEGRKLQSIEVHDLVCKIADIVVVGGVRRSALISLSNLSDQRMQSAKSGMWWDQEPHRALANNSTCYTEKPDMRAFMHEWSMLYQSKSGERGIFNREAVNKHVKYLDRREWEGQEFGTNPCSEIILRPRQFCNLSEVIIRPGDTTNDLHRKVRLATVLGTLQSSLTDFRYLHSSWQRNTEEERLLGVSLTGIMDHPEMSGMEWPKELGHKLEQLKQEVITTNKSTAKKLGIDPSVATTCVKPSGTVSQLVDSASGIHPRYSAHYIRTVRGDTKDPLTMFLKDQGVPNEPDATKPESTVVFSFPVEAPRDSVMRDALSATEQLELWKVYQEHWCEHKPSITVYVKEHEWMEVGAWVIENFDILSGVSFLPHTDHIYKQAPYQEITKEEYKEAVKAFPKELKWEDLTLYEQSDTTIGSQEYACVSGVCEI